MNKIRKAIIPAAGLGTRFLPATKALPKEMLPIIDTPSLQYIVEEAVNSGIEEIGIIVSMAKPSIEQHFSIDKKLENRLKAVNKFEEAEMIRDIANLIKITFIYQDHPRGLGHAIYCAKDFIGDEDFAIMLGDDVIVNQGGTPAMAQLVKAYEKTHTSILGVQEVPQDMVNKYGIVKPLDKQKKLMEINGMIEKPSPSDAPSNCAVLGRYILTNRIFDILKNQKPGKNNEIQLTDSIVTLLDYEKVYACEFEGIRYDIGDKFGYVKATIDFALTRPDLADKVKEYIKELSNKEN